MKEKKVVSYIEKMLLILYLVPGLLPVTLTDRLCRESGRVSILPVSSRKLEVCAPNREAWSEVDKFAGIRRWYYCSTKLTYIKKKLIFFLQNKKFFLYEEKRLGTIER